MPHLNVQLDSHCEAFIRNQMASGYYESEAELVRDALCHFEDFKKHRVIEAGSASVTSSGSGGLEVDNDPSKNESIEEIVDELDREFAQWLKP